MSQKQGAGCGQGRVGQMWYGVSYMTGSPVRRAHTRSLSRETSRSCARHSAQLAMLDNTLPAEAGSVDC